MPSANNLKPPLKVIGLLIVKSHISIVFVAVSSAEGLEKEIILTTKENVAPACTVNKVFLTALFNVPLF